eukprot:TRINITY_DN33599_c0_g1_i2.p1 TRINITY_DN33599_c0_g1~~TRINITY_DN33599_c0_g1_i2.p1  ORF type:complete len:759 (+),score=178.68 TRINITY_DN33599_c0_g1_i2:101-2377(+)
MGRGAPQTPSPRTCRLLGEVAMCAGEMEALNQKMGALRRVLHLPQGPSEESSTLASLEDDKGEGSLDDDCRILEAEEHLTGYLRQQQVAQEGSLKDFLPDAAPRQRRVRSRTWQSAAFKGNVPCCPASAAARRQAGSGAANVFCSCDPSQLLSKLCELGDTVENQRFELESLRNALQMSPPASPELAALASEGGVLERRTRGAVTSVASLRTEVASLAWSLDNSRQSIRSLQGERQQLLARLGELERSEASLRHASQMASETLAAERRQAEERAFGQESTLGALAARASEAELRRQSAEAAASRSRTAAIEAEAAVASSSRASAADAQRSTRQVKDLQERLVQEAETLECPGCGNSYLEDSLFCRHCGQKREDASSLSPVERELQAQQAHCAELRRAQQLLAARLESSLRCGEETESKALDVARELVDSSQAIAWLRSEVAHQRELQSELEEVERHNAWLQQCACNEEAEVELLARRASGEDVTPPVLDELRSLQATQARSVNEALQAAWEGEARDHRLAQRRLKSLEVSCLGPARQQLLRMAELGQSWRRDLLHLKASPGLEAGISAGGTRQDGAQALPDFPADVLQRLHGNQLPADAVYQLYACIKGLVVATAHCLMAMPTLPPTLVGGFGQHLKDERQHLDLELEQATSAAVRQYSPHPRASQGTSDSSNNHAAPARCSNRQQRPLAPPSRPLQDGYSSSSPSPSARGVRHAPLEPAASGPKSSTPKQQLAAQVIQTPLPPTGLSKILHGESVAE